MREKPLVLIIDDEPDIREIVKTKLEANGFEVKEAKDGVEGFNLVKELKPEIVLLDVVMPEMDGVETLLKIKEYECAKGSKIFLFTSKGDPRPEIVSLNRQFARESGATDFIRKEIDLNELVVRLQKAIQELKEEEKYQKIKEEALK